jgi:hypothetical protein
LSSKERKWLEKAEADSYETFEQQLQNEVEEMKGVTDEDNSTATKRRRILQILKSIENASKYIDIAIQHSPEIT